MCTGCLTLNSANIFTLESFNAIYSILAVNIPRVPGTKVLKAFLQTFGKIELKICTIKTIFFYDKHTLLWSFLPRDAMHPRY